MSGAAPHLVLHPTQAAAECTFHTRSGAASLGGVLRGFRDVGCVCVCVCGGGRGGGGGGAVMPWHAMQPVGVNPTCGQGHLQRATLIGTGSLWGLLGVAVVQGPCPGEG
jgi:hypothetical protein